MKDLKFTARIKHWQNNTYLAILDLGFGKFGIYKCDPEMNVLEAADANEWLWATASWDTPVERGEWESPFEEEEAAVTTALPDPTYWETASTPSPMEFWEKKWK